GHYHMPETRGLCLSEEQTVSSILRRPRHSAGNRVMDMRREPYKLTRRCEVTAILILYGLPSTRVTIAELEKERLLTGSILAHEMMHAWLRLRVIESGNYLKKSIHTENLGYKIDCNCHIDSEIGSTLCKGYRTLSQDVEEGICQVLAHMWLQTQIMPIPSSNVASTSSSASLMSRKHRERSPFDKKLGELFKHQIESDTSPVYGNGFRAGSEAVLKYGLERTLDHIRLTGTFPY
ncbi:hypothetical protein RJ639_039542, partial [Escallonia herrerae]